MSTVTPNLGLFKYNTSTDANSAFNINTALNNNWDIIDEAISNSGGARNLGEIVTSNIPLTDAGLHELDGSKIIAGGIYDEFIQHMANLYEENPDSPIWAKAETVKEYNYSPNGPLTEVNGILSGFRDSQGYATVQVKNPTTSFELCVKVRRDILQDNKTMIDTAQVQYHGILLRSHSSGKVYCYMGTTSWNVASNFDTTLTLSASVWTWFKITWDGTTYTFWKSIDGETWTKGATITSSVCIDFNNTYEQMNLGGTNWEGYAWSSNSSETHAKIDLNGCYMKVDGTFASGSSNMTGGILAWSGATNTYLSAEDVYSKSVEKYGECRKFVYTAPSNVSTESVRLPLVASEDRYLIDSDYSTGKWYRLYSDGWCEQGGSTHGVTGNVDVVLTIPYTTAEYTTQLQASYNANGTIYNRAVFNQSNTRFSFYADYTYPMYWHTVGYADVSSYKLSPKYEYVTVATVTKLPQRVVIDNIVEDLNNKVDKEDMTEVQCVIETYHNGSSWYRVYSDGWCEQGGMFPMTAVNTWFTLYLLKKFTGDDYQVTFGCSELATTSYPDSYGGCRNKTARSFQIGLRYSSSGTVANERYVMWHACGYLS